jgi:hypothetical protein
VVTASANLAHGFGHGLVSAWFPLALVGPFDLMRVLIRSGRGAWPGEIEPGERNQAAQLAHGIGHGTLVSAWPALALVGSFELLMMLIRTRRDADTGGAEPDFISILHRRWCRMHHRSWRLHHPWSRWSASGTKRATASAPSPEISTSTDARSSKSSTKRPSHFKIAAEREV